MNSTPPLRVLDWDSRFFGVKIARLEIPADDAPLRPLLQEAHRQEVRCCYLLCPAQSQTRLAEACSLGFTPVDIRVTLDHRCDAAPPAPADRPGCVIRPTRSEDLDTLRRLASALHVQSRFYADPHFARERCDALYARWVDRDFESPETQCLTLEWAGEPAGYGTIQTRSRTAEIGLFGLRTDLSGKGLGGDLLQALLLSAWNQGGRETLVATQGGNLAAQRLYQKIGFRIRSMHVWLHHWNPEHT